MTTLKNQPSIAGELNKVAKITLLFWCMKIVATTLGETLGDFISMDLHLGYGVGIAVTFAFFFVMLFAQLSVRRYVPVLYWLVIIGTTTTGTEISDYLDRSLHLGYAAGTMVLVSGLALTFLMWYATFRNLSVYPIADRRKEIYYWIAILFSNSLGTAFGDFLGEYLNVSYLQGALITGGVIVLVVLLHFYSRINHVLLFWIAFIFSRPFGATFGDFLTKPLDQGGLHLGTLSASLVAVGVMAVFLVMVNRRNDCG